MLRRGFLVAVAVMGMALMMPSVVNAQAQGGKGAKGNFDPAAFRQQQMDSIKQQLASTDDEWKVLQPKIEKIMTAQRDARSGGGRTRGGPAPDPATMSPLAKAMQDLRDGLAKTDTPADEIAKRLAAVREARAKSAADLLAAQKDLKEVVTPRQEAVLVSLGYLE